ncbi:CBS domain-containing protein [Candidatus Solirubrobacter pratensis]|uniref:CBS domain-containing protein n=1 Tax=Candidatus Solirubrobacter pratensis TaxID=1298857 RepID=UPI0004029CA5|nr:CBS domain-containing protein [Candidatus Solirubrobacter pratensis]
MGSTRHIPLDQAGPTVADVMLAEARTIAPDTPAAAVRETFENPSVKLLLVADGDRFLGTVAPDDVPADGAIGPAVNARTPCLRPDEGIPRALELLEHTSRVPVVDADGRLHGLVCLNRSKSAFCASPLPR